MTNPREKISDHYTVEDLGSTILAALQSGGKDLESLTLDDLAPVDEFHIRGRSATEELAREADVQPQHEVLDVGCGLGHMLRRMKTRYPPARCDGVEYSAYLCEKYGWTQGSIVDLEAPRRYHLVICNDVLQYLDDKQGAVAMRRLSALTRYALFFSALTREDWADVADRERTDDRVYMRSADWYRRRLRRYFIQAGGGLFVSRRSSTVLWELEKLP